MSYQYPYNNSFNRKKNNSTYLSRLSKQLACILILMLVLILLKYVKNGTTEVINTKIKDVISVDYTEQAKSFLISKSPDINGYINNFLNKFKTGNSFHMEYLPIDGKIISSFGKRTNPITKKEENHSGIDIEAKEKSNVKAVFDGTVKTVENSKTMGLTMVIDHNNGFETVYAFLSEVKANEGESITKGSVIALTGSSSEAAGPHLHFELHKNGMAVNPLDYLNSK